MNNNGREKKITNHFSSGKYYFDCNNNHSVKDFFLFLITIIHYGVDIDVWLLSAIFWLNEWMKAETTTSNILIMSKFSFSFSVGQKKKTKNRNFFQELFFQFVFHHTNSLTQRISRTRKKTTKSIDRSIDWSMNVIWFGLLYTTIRIAHGCKLGKKILTLHQSLSFVF